MHALQPSLPGYEIDSWETSFPELQSALSTKGGVMNIFSVIMLFIAGIGILNLLLMAVFERTREIGVLGALGLKPAPDLAPVRAGRRPDGPGRRGRRRGVGAADQRPARPGGHGL